MPCPHGSGLPASCSMCRGVVPKIVTRDSAGAMRVDGVVVKRQFQPASSYRNGPPKRRLGRPSNAVRELRRREQMRMGDDDTGGDEE